MAMRSVVLFMVWKKIRFWMFLWFIYEAWANMGLQANRSFYLVSKPEVLMWFREKFLQVIGIQECILRVISKWSGLKKYIISFTCSMSCRILLKYLMLRKIALI